ncbi:MAG: CCA tRNA nucleotidyltransferase [Candidatus Bathyarchaeota archaeon]|nr:CCA tRNA nucleotidyltransferase [Candidatus Bathyarchaeota archaeon]
MQKEIDTVTRQVLEEITPSPADRQKMSALARELELKVSAACKELGVEATVRVEGSFAKDTWLRGDPDIDVFMRLPTSVPRKSLGEVALEIARKATQGAQQVERFAEHPYLEAFVDDTRVNIVPCYDAKPSEWLSATDRTPYHTEYINQHLAKELRGDVRLLKRFMKGIGVYGAEIKVGGFSGYLCELLVLHYGGFQKALQTLAQHQPRRVIDIEGYYQGRQRELDMLFPETLVVVDPVDKARNVASAVQPQRLHAFVAASRAFQKQPNKEFFTPLKTQPLTVEELHQTLQNRGSTLVFLAFSKIQAVPDVLWGQLYRTQKALRKQLELGDFKVLRDAVWSEEHAKDAVFVFELEQRTLPDVKKHLGPPLELQRECENFLSKYTEKPTVSAGPFIDQGRWVVELTRKFTDATELLKARVAGGGRNAGVAELIAKALKEHFLVLVCEEVTEHYIYNEGFAEFLTDFLSGKPFWLHTDT